MAQASRAAKNAVYKAMGKMKYIGERLKYHLGGGEYGKRMNERDRKMEIEAQARKNRIAEQELMNWYKHKK